MRYRSRRIDGLPVEIKVQNIFATGTEGNTSEKLRIQVAWASS